MIAILTTLLALVLAGCGDEREVTPVARASSTTAEVAPESAATAEAAPVTQSVKFRASDGAELHADVRGAGDLQPRPLIVEFSPYGMGSSVPDFGPDYNHVFRSTRAARA